jgi:hypothetical protein
MHKTEPSTTAVKANCTVVEDSHRTHARTHRYHNVVHTAARKDVIRIHCCVHIDTCPSQKISIRIKETQFDTHTALVLVSLNSLLEQGHTDTRHTRRIISSH